MPPSLGCDPKTSPVSLLAGPDSCEVAPALLLVWCEPPDGLCGRGQLAGGDVT